MEALRGGEGPGVARWNAGRGVCVCVGGRDDRFEPFSGNQCLFSSKSFSKGTVKL